MGPDAAARRGPSGRKSILALVLLLGLLVRLPFAIVDYHVGVDLDIFRRWARSVQDQGLALSYTSGNVDYPPMALHLLRSAAIAASWLAPPASGLGERALTAFIKLLPVLADILTGWLIVWGLGGRGPGRGLLGGGLYVFNPGIWYVSAYWGQLESVYTFFLVAAATALGRGAIIPAWACYALALGTKFQSVALAPVLVVGTAVAGGLRGVLVGLASAAATGAVLCVPWLAAGRLGDVVRVYIALPSEAPRIDVSAYNAWYLLLRGRVHHVSSWMSPPGLPVTYQTVGIALFSALAALVGVLAWRRRTLTLPAAALSLGLFMLATQVHERYMYPALAFLALGSSGRQRLWGIYALLSATFLFNLVTIAPFSSALGTNLVAAEATAGQVVLLKRLALLAAGLNLGALAWLVTEVAASRDDDPLARSGLAAPGRSG